MITTKTRAANSQDAMLVSITVGGSPGTLRIYSGTVPADLTVTPTGTLLVSANIGSGSTQAFGATSSSTLVATGLGVPWSGTITASGTAAYWRIYDASNNAVLQGSVGTSGSGAELILTSLTFTAGGTFSVSAFTATISGVT